MKTLHFTAAISVVAASLWATDVLNGAKAKSMKPATIQEQLQKLEERIDMLQSLYESCIERYANLFTLAITSEDQSKEAREFTLLNKAEIDRLTKEVDRVHDLTNINRESIAVGELRFSRLWTDSAKLSETCQLISRQGNAQNSWLRSHSATIESHTKSITAIWAVLRKMDPEGRFWR